MQGVSVLMALESETDKEGGSHLQALHCTQVIEVRSLFLDSIDPYIPFHALLWRFFGAPEPRKLQYV